MNARILAKMKLAGILPNDVLTAATTSPPADSFGRDILALMHAAWQRAAVTSCNPVAGPRLDWCQRSLAAGRSLRLLSETNGSPVVVELLGPRLLWCPPGVSGKTLFGLTSSRLGRELERRQAWFQTLRAACARCREAHELLLTARGTVPARFVMRCQDLFGVGVLEIVPPQTNDVDAWFRETLEATPSEGTQQDLTQQVYVSPRLDDADRSPHETIPLADRAMAALSDRLLLLFVRRGGHWEQLVKWRTTANHWPPGQTMLALGKGLVHPRLRDELLCAGAVGWTILETHDAQTENFPSERGEHSAGDFSDESKSLPSWTYLTHCTRRRDGPWPDQVDDVYLDDLILGRPEADHSPLAALARIVHTERLIATCASVSGKTPVVSFTEVPLEELQALRVFRRIAAIGILNLTGFAFAAIGWSSTTYAALATHRKSSGNACPAKSVCTTSSIFRGPATETRSTGPWNKSGASWATSFSIH